MTAVILTFNSQVKTQPIAYSQGIRSERGRTRKYAQSTAIIAVCQQENPDDKAKDDLTHHV